MQTTQSTVRLYKTAPPEEPAPQKGASVSFKLMEASVVLSPANHSVQPQGLLMCRDCAFSGAESLVRGVRTVTQLLGELGPKAWETAQHQQGLARARPFLVVWAEPIVRVQLCMPYHPHLSGVIICYSLAIPVVAMAFCSSLFLPCLGATPH